MFQSLESLSCFRLARASHFTRQLQTAVSPHPLKIGHMFMTLFTRNSPYHQLLKYLLFLLKRLVYVCASTAYIYRVSQEERTKLREGVPYVKLY